MAYHETRTVPGSGPRGWQFRILTVIAATVATLLVAELAVRLFSLGPEIHAVWARNYRLSDNPVLRYELVPHSPYGGGTINPDGMQDRPRAVQKPPGTFRIACMGDSVTYGVCATQRETYPSRLEEYLNRHFALPGRRFEVLNFGVTGYNITQIMESLRVRALKYDPDLIIYAYCLNDPQEYSYEFEALCTRLTPAQYNYWAGLHDAGASLLARSRLYLLVRYRWQTLPAARRETPHLGREEQWRHLDVGTYAGYFSALHENAFTWRRLTAGLDRLSDIADQHAIPAYVVIFPVFRDLDDYPLAGVHEQVVQAARDRSLLALDLLGLYQKLHELAGDAFVGDALHPNGMGNAYAAMLMLRQLLRDGHLPAAAGTFEDVMASGTAEAEIAVFIHEQL